MKLRYLIPHNTMFIVDALFNRKYCESYFSFQLNIVGLCVTFSMSHIGNQYLKNVIMISNYLFI